MSSQRLGVKLFVVRALDSGLSLFLEALKRLFRKQHVPDCHARESGHPSGRELDSRLRGHDVLSRTVRPFSYTGDERSDHGFYYEQVPGLLRRYTLTVLSTEAIVE